MQKTLKLWDEDFVQTQEYSQNNDFSRLWHFYLKYCEGGFRSEKIGVSKITFIKE